MVRREGYVPLIPKDRVEEFVARNRHLVPGTEVSISRERGRFRFVNAQVTSTGRMVLNFIGGAAGHEVFRSFYPERVRRVHRLSRTRANSDKGKG